MVSMEQNNIQMEKQYTDGKTEKYTDIKLNALIEGEFLSRNTVLNMRPIILIEGELLSRNTVLTIRPLY